MEDISLNSNFASNIAMKTAPEHVESLSNNPSETLSPSHREYLLERHGQANLVPLPSEDPLDPYNWPARKVSPMKSNDRGHSNGTNLSHGKEKRQSGPRGLPRTDVHGRRRRGRARL
jgi:hypothetical protein